MLFRFSLYGFLKNLRFFEPFLILFFRDRGLSFTEIGLLIGYRELCINLLEIPSGALADLYGRRRAMMFSFVAYIVSFALFAVGSGWPLLLVAMAFFATGEAFRTGTHKAMIFDYLRREGRVNERTTFYGTTRSWSKNGTAVCVVVASAVVFISAGSGTTNYAALFWASIVPYCIALWNFACYPKYLDATTQETTHLRTVIPHLLESFKDCVRNARLRSLLVEGMTYQALFATTKDYVQPLVKNWVLLLPVVWGLKVDQRTAVLLGAVSFALAIVSGIGSKRSAKFSDRCGGEDRGAYVGWIVTLLVYLALAPSLHWKPLYPIAVAVFVLLYLAANLYRPMQLSRLAGSAPTDKGATILSIESQGKSLTTLVLAPIAGALVDHYGLAGVAVLGLAVTGFRLALRLVGRRPIKR